MKSAKLTEEQFQKETTVTGAQIWNLKDENNERMKREIHPELIEAEKFKLESEQEEEILLQKIKINQD